MWIAKGNVARMKYGIAMMDLTPSNHVVDPLALSLSMGQLAPDSSLLETFDDKHAYRQ